MFCCVVVLCRVVLLLIFIYMLSSSAYSIAVINLYYCYCIYSDKTCDKIHFMRPGPPKL